MKMKKMLSIVLSVAMLASMTTVLAEATELPDYNTAILADGELTVPVLTEIGGTETEEVVLDFGMTFTAVETFVEAASKPYINYNADFVLVFDKDVTVLPVGQYDHFNENWIALADPSETVEGFSAEGYTFKAGEHVRVMKDLFGGAIAAVPEEDRGELTPGDFYLTYADILNFVREFNCGVVFSDDAPAGVSATLSLCLYETETKWDWVNPEDESEGKTQVITETGTKYELGDTYTYLYNPFELKDAAGTVKGTYMDLASAVAAAEDGDMLTLAADYAGAGVVVDKNIVIDLGFNTYTTTSGLQLAKDKTVTIKNGTVEQGDAGVTTLIHNSSNLTLSNVTLDGSMGCDTVLSNNCGNTVITDATNITAADGKTAIEVSYEPQSGNESVNVTVTNTMSGTVTGKMEYKTDGTEATEGKHVLNINGGKYTESEVVTDTDNVGLDSFVNSGYKVETSGGQFVINTEAKTSMGGYSGGGGSGSSTRKYTVKFVMDGGSGVESKTVVSGETIGEVAEPTKEGYVFAGWYTDKELTKEFLADTKITKETTLYAKWEEVKESKDIVLVIGQKVAEVFGADKENDVAPMIKNDRTMVPSRFVAENLGADVVWNETERKVTITKGDVEIVIYIDSDKALVNGEEVTLDAPAFIENDRTFTPLRFISEKLGGMVDWNEETQTVTITVE